MYLALPFWTARKYLLKLGKYYTEFTFTLICPYHNEIFAQKQFRFFWYFCPAVDCSLSLAFSMPQTCTDVFIKSLSVPFQLRETITLHFYGKGMFIDHRANDWLKVKVSCFPVLITALVLSRLAARLSVTDPVLGSDIRHTS